MVKEPQNDIKESQTAALPQNTPNMIECPKCHKQILKRGAHNHIKFCGREKAKEAVKDEPNNESDNGLGLGTMDNPDGCDNSPVLGEDTDNSYQADNDNAKQDNEISLFWVIPLLLIALLVWIVYSIRKKKIDLSFITKHFKKDVQNEEIENSI